MIMILHFVLFRSPIDQQWGRYTAMVQARLMFESFFFGIFPWEKLGHVVSSSTMRPNSRSFLPSFLHSFLLPSGFSSAHVIRTTYSRQCSKNVLIMQCLPVVAVARFSISLKLIHMRSLQNERQSAPKPQCDMNWCITLYIMRVMQARQRRPCRRPWPWRNYNLYYKDAVTLTKQRPCPLPQVISNKGCDHSIPTQRPWSYSWGLGAELGV